MLSVVTKARRLCAYGILLGALIVSGLAFALYPSQPRISKDSSSSSVHYGPIVEAVAFSPHGETLAVAAGNHVLMIKDGSARPFATIELPEVVQTVIFSPNGKVLACASSSQIKLCDAATGQEQKRLKGYDPHCLAFSHNGEMMVVGGFVEDPKIRILRLVDDSPPKILGQYHLYIAAIAFSNDGKYVISVGDQDQLKIWDLASGGVIKSLDSHVVLGAGIQCLAVNPDGKTFAVGGHERNVGSVHFLDFDLKGRGHFKTTQPVNAVAYSPDGVMLAVGCGLLNGKPGEVSLWRIADAKQMVVLNGHTAPVQSLAFSSNGERLVTGSEDGSYKVRSMTPWYMSKAGR